MRERTEWSIQASSFAKLTFNPIRNIVENLQIVPHPDKPMIALSIGDPTVFGNLNPAVEVTEAVVEAVRSGKANGYAPSTGYVKSREAVAAYCSLDNGLSLDAKDIILCSGCSCALDICITALCNPGQNILVPRPGFPLYETLAVGLGIKVKHYDLSPEKNWEVDLAMMDDLIDDLTAAVVVNNPSNPCGSVFSKKHLEDILQIANRNKVPIIADEIYNDFVFEGHDFHYMASLSSEVPVLTCGGLTKRFLIPGWRMGWIVINDRGGVLAKEIRIGLNSLSQRIIGSNTLVQAALPDILAKTPESFYRDTIKQIEENAMLCYGYIKRTPGLNPIMPQGAMYMMVGISMQNFPEFQTDLELVERMISEESVFCLPGKCFSLPNFFRVVLTVPIAQMEVACERILAFCTKHYVPTVEGLQYLSKVSNPATHVLANKSLSNGANGPHHNCESSSNGIANGNSGAFNGRSNGASNSDLLDIDDTDDFTSPQMPAFDEVEVRKMKIQQSSLKNKICISLEQETD